MSRAARTVRGAAGALIATVFAAASHSLAGGSVTPLSVLATALVALPLCVALAGRTGSLWRLGLAVAASQFLYHWSFVGLGAGSGAAGTAAHSHALSVAFSPVGASAGMAATGASDAWMWAAHALAAALTIALMHSGERAALGLARLIRSVLPALPTPPPAPIAHRHTILNAFFPRDALRERLNVLSAISHRGPPAALAAIGR